MTPEQQRIAIARACGWTAEQDSNGYWRAVSHKHGNAVELWLSERNVWSVGIPDYLNDLNAMHEAKQMLINKGLMWQFANQIIGTTCCAKGLSLQKLEQQDYLVFLASSTAELEAEAFLRTLDLWQETKTQPVTEESSVASAVRESFTTDQ